MLTSYYNSQFCTGEINHLSVFLVSNFSVTLIHHTWFFYMVNYLSNWFTLKIYIPSKKFILFYTESCRNGKMLPYSGNDEHQVLISGSTSAPPFPWKPHLSLCAWTRPRLPTPIHLKVTLKKTPLQNTALCVSIMYSLMYSDSLLQITKHQIINPSVIRLSFSFYITHK